MKRLGCMLLVSWLFITNAVTVLATEQTYPGKSSLLMDAATGTRIRSPPRKLLPPKEAVRYI